MTDVRAQQAHQAQQAQAQAQQAQAQQAQRAQAQQAQAKSQTSRSSISTGDSDSSDGIKAEIGKLKAEEQQYKKLLDTEISKFESDLRNVVSDYSIALSPDLNEYTQLTRGEGSSGPIEDKFCICGLAGNSLTTDEENSARLEIERIKGEIKKTPLGVSLFETHKYRILYEQILDFAIICHNYFVTVYNYIRLLGIINKITKEDKKISDYSIIFRGILIGSDSMANILVDAENKVNEQFRLVQGPARNLSDEMKGKKREYAKKFTEAGLDMDTYLSLI